MYLICKCGVKHNRGTPAHVDCNNLKFLLLISSFVSFKVLSIQSVLMFCHLASDASLQSCSKGLIWFPVTWLIGSYFCSRWSFQLSILPYFLAEEWFYCLCVRHIINTFANVWCKFLRITDSLCDLIFVNVPIDTVEVVWMCCSFICTYFNCFYCLSYKGIRGKKHYLINQICNMEEKSWVFFFSFLAQCYLQFELGPEHRGCRGPIKIVLFIIFVSYQMSCFFVNLTC